MKLNQNVKLQLSIVPELMDCRLLWGIYGATAIAVLLVLGANLHLLSTTFQWLGWCLFGVCFGLAIVLRQRVEALAIERAQLRQQLQDTERRFRQLVEQFDVGIGVSLDGTIGQIEDLTSRKQAEMALVQANAALEQRIEQQTAELATSQSQMQAILDRMPAAIYIDGLDGRLQFANTQWQKLFGSVDENPVGRYLSDIIVPEPNSAAILMDENQSVAASGKAMTFEQEAILPDGVHTYLKVKFPLQDPGGEIHAICGISIDITDRKQMEMALKESEQQLQALTCQLQQQNEQLEEVSRLKSEFLTNMSHELRTPLTSILGFSDVLLQRIFGPLTAKQEEYLSRIHSSGEHLLGLINDLLDLAKIEAGRLELYPERVDLVELCQVAVQMIEVRALAKQQKMCLELPMAVESAIVDRQRVIQILLNYLSNAVKFTPAGGTIKLSSQLLPGLELAAQHSTTTINQSCLSTTSAKCFLVLSVSDTGIGVPLEKQHLLFQTFQQVDGAIDRHYEGSGLGLALTRRLAELHGGTVSFTSTPKVGSTFSVWLPLADSDSGEWGVGAGFSIPSDYQQDYRLNPPVQE